MKNCIQLSLVFLFLVSCGKQSKEFSFPKFAFVAAEMVRADGDTTAILMGGYGSSLVYNAVDSCFYLLTDRGANIDGLTSESKVFPISDFAPTIGRFRLKGDSLTLLSKIVLKDRYGRSFTGLPNTQGDGVTGEVAYNLQGEVVANSKRGLDSEGLTIAPDGTFWVCDEYAPFIMQFDKDGTLLRELSPSNGLPSYFAKRRPNRGMEGLTISKDGKTLYGIMQSPLYMPDKSTKDSSRLVRIIEIELASGKTREFVYQLDSPLNVVSEISFVNHSVMLVLERDALFPNDGKGFKKVFKININQASDVSGVVVEMLSINEMKERGVNLVSKELFVDILVAIPDYRHDKPEGITLINDSILCVVNDDDFGISASGNGKYIPKLDTKGVLDRNVVYFIPVKW